MGVLDKLNDRLAGMVNRLETATSKAGTGVRAANTIGGTGPGMTPLAAMSGSDRNLEAAVKAETRARTAAAKALEAETAEKRALLPAIRAQSRLEALTLRTEEQQARAYQAASRLGIGSAAAAGSANAGQGGGGSPSVMGSLGLGQFAGATGAVGIGVAAAMHFGNESIAALNTSQRTDLTQTQRSVAMRESVPVFGPVANMFRRSYESGAGITESARRAAVEHQEMQARISVGTGAQRDVLEIRRQAGLASHRADALADHPYAPLRTDFDRGSTAGERAYQEYQTQRPVQERAVRLHREAQALRAQANDRQRDAFEGRGRLSRAIGFRDEAVRRDKELRSSGTDTRDDRYRSASHVANASAMVESVRQTSQAQDSAARQANVQAMEAESSARRGLIEVIGTEAEKLKQKEGRIRGNAGRFGAMTPFDRMKAMNAADAAEQYGIDNIAPEMRATLRSAAPDYTRNQEEQLGERTPEYQEYARRGYFLNDTESLADVHQQQSNVQARITNVINLDEAELANQIKDALSDKIGDLIDSIQSRVEDAIGDIQAERQMQNAME